jgi:CDP-diacylglycerol--glycerol-3-phosphate 3-phosphatidyltransferase
MGIYAIKPRFQQLLTPVKNALVRAKIHPTIINLAGLVLSLCAGVALYYSSEVPRLLLVVPIAGFVRTACNALDGLVSRELGVASGLGEVLNEFFDRISDSAFFLGLAFAPGINLRLGVITLTVILLNSYLSIVSKAAGGSRQYGGVMGKADRMIYIGSAAVLVLITGNTEIWQYFLWFVLVGTLVTMAQRFAAVKRELS